MSRTTNFLDFSREIDDFFTKGFSMPRGIVFNVSGTKVLMPACWKEYLDKDGKKIGYKAICRTVGIATEDVKLEIKDDCILVTGETEYDSEKYNTRYELPIAEDVMGNIEKIQYKTLNGLTYIYLTTKLPEKKQIAIERA